MNPWLWFFLILLPLFVVSVKPGAAGWLYIGRLLAAILLGYVLLNLWLRTQHQLLVQEYESCMSPYRDGDPIGFKKCFSDGLIADGASNLFYLYLGWVPSYAYVGLWEWVWRRKNKDIISRLEAFEGNWFSILIIILSWPVFLYVLLLFIGFVHLQILHKMN
ncbi:MAG: hypothetical protein K2Q12_02185 [Rickettsiales bacterium]|nr:hypothetical protein [Rickettsiales bacterium]